MCSSCLKRCGDKHKYSGFPSDWKSSVETDAAEVKGRTDSLSSVSGESTSKSNKPQKSASPSTSSSLASLINSATVVTVDEALKQSDAVTLANNASTKAVDTESVPIADAALIVNPPMTLGAVGSTPASGASSDIPANNEVKMLEV